MNGLWQVAFRAGSWDQDIWNSVRYKNEYGITERFEGCVLDIGAHIGAFSSLALAFGAKRIIAVEPDEDNCDLLRFNSKHMIRSGVLSVYQAAIAEKDGTKFAKAADTWPNTGGAAYCESPTGNIKGVSIDTLLRHIDLPVLIKIDCEGAEFAALEGSGLEKVVAIVGEYHGNVDTLRDNLMAKRFAFSSHATGQNIGLFGANRKKH